MTEIQWNEIAYPYGQARLINWYHARADIQLLREQHGDCKALRIITADILAAQGLPAKADA